MGTTLRLKAKADCFFAIVLLLMEFLPVADIAAVGTTFLVIFVEMLNVKAATTFEEGIRANGGGIITGTADRDKDIMGTGSLGTNSRSGGAGTMAASLATTSCTLESLQSRYQIAHSSD